MSCSDSDKTTILRKGKRGQPGSQLGGSCASVAMIWLFNVLAHCNEDRAVLIRGPTAGLTPVLPTPLNDVRISSCPEVVEGQESI
jgi:hypothetical protein